MKGAANAPGGPTTMSITLLNSLKAVQIGTGIKAGFCGKLLVDAGAEVIKLDLPDAAPADHFSPWLDRGKASVVLDWRISEGYELLRRLLDTVDLVISDLDNPQDAATVERLAAEQPRVVYTALSDLGRQGPFADRPSSDLIVSALSGMCYINGEAGRPPLREPGNQTAIVAALAGFMGALAALVDRSQSGLGQAVEVSALEAMVNVLSPSVLQCSYQNGAPFRRQTADGFLFDCADGKVSVIISSQSSWDTILEIWGIVPDPNEADRFTEKARRANMESIRRLFAPVLLSKTRREVFEELCLVRVPCGMLLNPGELPSDKHLIARGSFDAVPWSSTAAAAGPFPGPGFRIAGEIPTTERCLPRPGEDTARLLAPLLAGTGSPAQ
ncbi:MAG: hypothetical protein C0506_14330 [Anaerolinea sp.]|nr:hypothetical protein [Anaerolinea sp.]